MSVVRHFQGQKNPDENLKEYNNGTIEKQHSQKPQTSNLEPILLQYQKMRRF